MATPRHDDDVLVWFPLWFCCFGFLFGPIWFMCFVFCQDRWRPSHQERGTRRPRSRYRAPPRWQRAVAWRMSLNGPGRSELSHRCPRHRCACHRPRPRLCHPCLRPRPSSGGPAQTESRMSVACWLACARAPRTTSAWRQGLRGGRGGGGTLPDAFANFGQRRPNWLRS